MVIAAMNPLISSCLIVASLRSAATDSTWPCNVYSRSGLESPQAETSSVSAIQQVKKPHRWRVALMSIVYREPQHDLDWHLRLQLSRVEGQLLSGGSCGEENAAVLRGAVSDR